MRSKLNGESGLRFDVYGRFVIEATRRGEGWAVYRVEQGRRVHLQEIVIPPDLPSDQIPRYLDDLWHESAVPGKAIRRLK